ncbi:MAG: RluA family pseudouridine synthase [Spartobacteria bacterium]|nr:RluA family pseudouridine synthase [Spartobacteria bacterium]
MTTAHVQPEEDGARLDVWLTQHEPDHSRARWQKLIQEGHVLVNGEVRKSRYEVHPGDEIFYEIPPPEVSILEPEDIALDILYEDSDVIVINKQPDLIVHPAPGHSTGTLVHALLHHCRDLAGIGGELRPGIVHRLDMDTSGAMVIAKNEFAMNDLQQQFRTRDVHKEYMTIVRGHPAPAHGTIDTLIARSVRDRKKMCVSSKSGRNAITHYETIETYDHFALLRVTIETGRTHQIRVHMAHKGHPVLGDRQYGRARYNDLAMEVQRQMLHAEKLSFNHPQTGEQICFIAPIHDDMRTVIRFLRETKTDR